MKSRKVKWKGYSRLPLYAVKNYEKLEEEAAEILKRRKEEQKNHGAITTI